MSSYEYQACGKHGLSANIFRSCCLVGCLSGTVIGGLLLVISAAQARSLVPRLESNQPSPCAAVAVVTGLNDICRLVKMAETPSQGKRTLRKRKQSLTTERADAGTLSLEEVLDMAEASRKVLVFSGSGLSASSGMSTFTTPGGLYDRARKRFKLSDGKKLFHYSFFHKRRLDCMAFLADIYTEAVVAQPSPGHKALAELWRKGILQRHYTMNIDGLAEAVGMDTWQPMPAVDPENKEDLEIEYPREAAASTVEMHGNIRQLVCTECYCWADMDTTKSRQIQRKRVVACTNCGKGPGLRPRVMLYDDDEGDAITPEDIFDIMKADVASADLILWVGISFEQSASTMYFREVRTFLMEQKLEGKVKQVIVNPSDEAHWNVVSACSNLDDLKVYQVLATGDTLLPKMAQRCKEHRSV